MLQDPTIALDSSVVGSSRNIIRGWATLTITLMVVEDVYGTGSEDVCAVFTGVVHWSYAYVARAGELCLPWGEGRGTSEGRGASL